MSRDVDNIHTDGCRDFDYLRFDNARYVNCTGDHDDHIDVDVDAALDHAYRYFHRDNCDRDVDILRRDDYCDKHCDLNDL